MKQGHCGLVCLHVYFFKFLDSTIYYVSFGFLSGIVMPFYFQIFFVEYRAIEYFVPLCVSLDGSHVIWCSGTHHFRLFHRSWNERMLKHYFKQFKTNIQCHYSAPWLSFSFNFQLSMQCSLWAEWRFRLHSSLHTHLGFIHMVRFSISQAGQMQQQYTFSDSCLTRVLPISRWFDKVF